MMCRKNYSWLLYIASFPQGKITTKPYCFLWSTFCIYKKRATTSTSTFSVCYFVSTWFWKDLRKSTTSMCHLPLVKISRFKNFVYPKGRERYNQIHGIEIITFLMFAATHMVICFHKIFFRFSMYVVKLLSFLYI